MRFRKKPIEIEAFQYDGDLKYQDEKYYVPEWAINAYGETMYYRESELYIATLEGEHHVSIGDYIIQGVQGELYPCKPNIFEKTYEVVEQKEG